MGLLRLLLDLDDGAGPVAGLSLARDFQRPALPGQDGWSLVHDAARFAALASGLSTNPALDQSRLLCSHGPRLRTTSRHLGRIPLAGLRVSLWPKLRPRVFPVVARNDLVAGRSRRRYKGVVVLTNPRVRFGRSPDVLNIWTPYLFCHVAGGAGKHNGLLEFMDDSIGPTFRLSRSIETESFGAKV